MLAIEVCEFALCSFLETGKSHSIKMDNSSIERVDHFNIWEQP